MIPRICRNSSSGDNSMEQAVQNVVLDCQPEFSSDRLKIGYRISNRGSGQIYVLDVLPGYDAARTPAPNPDWAYVCLRDGPAAYVLRGIPPLPADRQVTIQLIPLATRLAAGEKLERAFELPLPLKETSPYYLPLKPEQYEVIELWRMVFGVHYLPGAVEGFRVEPAPHGQGFYRVWSKNPVAQAQTLEHEFDAPGVSFWKRRDWFSRI